MKVLIATVLSAISIADGQVLRAAASRQRMMEDSERKTMQDMSMSMDIEHIVPTHTLEHIVPTYSPTTEQDWQSYQLTPTSTLNYIIKSDALHAEVIYDGDAWLGIAVSEDGRMVGSEAIIGTLDDGTVQKYYLGGKMTSLVQPMPSEQQTLVDASIETTTDGKTVMKFTKLLSEDGEIEIAMGSNILYARGWGTSLGYHSEREVFTLGSEVADTIESDHDQADHDHSSHWFGWPI